MLQLFYCVKDSAWVCLHSASAHISRSLIMVWICRVGLTMQKAGI